MAWFVYLLRCRDGSIYIGTTTDPARRFREHAGALGRGAKYTAAKKPERFESVFEVPDRSGALRLEARLKKLSHAQREALAAGGPLPSDAPEARRVALSPDGTETLEAGSL